MLDDLITRARGEYLDCFGLLHSRPQDGLGDGTIVLFGPYEPGFWTHFKASPEYNDQTPDPMDRWSTRVVTRLADQSGGTPLFPFGEPARPFIGWALASGHVYQSPVSILVHARIGMFVSFRGAVFLPKVLELPEKLENPCTSCADKPCLTACPPRALTEAGYDLAACHDFLDETAGESCRTQGCAVRRSCPLARNYPRLEEHSEYHMKVFHPWPSRLS